ncbi:MAG: alanine racemase [Candidatus Eremiobacteraeota bacterium]|nr:alanine racemase [Candidatus Eremiobacteraeota bacterium]MBC5803442.1 alanine racemase [Candidatus Eremiobacteraeota bacterium]MBC5821503.1 alanine racemase [Candidatus Eremiobacteraeota bacterium]
MRPTVGLDRAIVTANARAWRAFAGVPLRAVVKGDGYGWGYRALVAALEGEVEAFCVADADELRELRRHTAAPAIILGDVPPEQLPRALAVGALTNIGTAVELDLAQRHARDRDVPLRIRVGVRPAVTWSGLSLDEIRAFAPLLARAGAQVEVWSHITDYANRTVQRSVFREAVEILRRSQVDVAETELASTFPLAGDGALGSRVRIGVGLFGATGGIAVPGVRCALNVIAPVTRVDRLSATMRVGYGERLAGAQTDVATARCGYADGLPQSLAGSDGILSVGMQYVTVEAARTGRGRSSIVLLDETVSLDEFAARAGRLPHEVVTTFGNAASAHAVHRRPE